MSSLVSSPAAPSPSCRSSHGELRLSKELPTSRSLRRPPSSRLFLPTPGPRGKVSVRLRKFPLRSIGTFARAKEQQRVPVLPTVDLMGATLARGRRSHESTPTIEHPLRTTHAAVKKGPLSEMAIIDSLSFCPSPVVAGSGVARFRALLDVDHFLVKTQHLRKPQPSSRPAKGHLVWMAGNG